MLEQLTFTLCDLCLYFTTLLDGRIPIALPSLNHSISPCGVEIFAHLSVGLKTVLLVQLSPLMF